ncbi:hypothetical protein AAG906_027525 [Vitis piasezkii]
MKALWDELASYHDPLPCTCENERVVQFLMGLNESYATQTHARPMLWCFNKKGKLICVYKEDDWPRQAT